VPDERAAPAYRNVLTGEQVAITARDGRPGLALDAVFAIFPVALLEGIDER
jgi:hypothetical protein